jgi:hypothetical protein
MATLREKLAAASDNDDALRLVVDARPKLFAMVAELREAHGGSSKLSDKSRDSYSADAKRVANAGGDPRTLAGTYASFRKLRAACIWRILEELRECLARADRLRKKTGNDLGALCIYDEELPAIKSRIAFLSSLKFDQAQQNRREKTHKQRHKLGRLPSDWISKIHAKTMGGKYGQAVALSILIPVRPAEIAERVSVRLDGGDLVFEVKGAKVKAKGSGVASNVDGIGQPLRVVRLSAVDASRFAVFEWLKKEVSEAGGSLVVGKGVSASGLSSAFRAMSARLFNGYDSPPSIYALRHAASAEIKASGVGGIEVAASLGHASEASQKAYGTSSQARGGYVVSASASGPIRPLNASKPPPSMFRKVSKGPNKSPPAASSRPRMR